MSFSYVPKKSLSPIPMNFVHLSTIEKFLHTADKELHLDIIVDVEIILQFLQDIRFMNFLLINKSFTNLRMRQEIQKELDGITLEFNNFPLFIKNKWLYITNPHTNISDKKLIKNYIEIQRDTYIYKSLLNFSTKK